MSFTIHITNDFDQMSYVAGQIAEASIAARQAEADSFVLGLATGNSPTGLYKYLAKSFNSGQLDATRVRTFSLDEYAGLPGENAQQRTLHPESYSFFMMSELFGLLTPRFAETNLPWGSLIAQPDLDAALASGEGFEYAGTDAGRAIVISPDADGYLGWVRDEIQQAYSDKITAAGGIDLHVIGVGGRGHVAFHESGIPYEAGDVLLVSLDDNTVANAVTDGHFPSADVAPHFAVSMGARKVFQAREILMVANGARKVGPVTESVLGPVTDDVPLSYVQNYVADGGTLNYVLDAVAAEGLLAREDDVRARGIEIVDHRGESYPPLTALTFTRSAATNTLV